MRRTTGLVVLVALAAVLLGAGASAAGGPEHSNAPIDQVIIGVLDTTTGVWTAIDALPDSALTYTYLGPQDLPPEPGEIAGQGTPCAILVRVNGTWRLECTDGRGTDWRSRRELDAMTVR